MFISARAAKQGWPLLCFVLFLTLACIDETPQPGPPTATASPAQPGNATPDPKTVKELRVGPEVSVPREWGLIIEHGCYNCDGPPSDMARIYRSRQGELRKESLLNGQPDIPQVGNLPNRVGIVSLAVPPTGGRITVSTCLSGPCGPLGDVAGGSTALLQSDDGGVSWREMSHSQGLYYAVGATDNEVLVHDVGQAVQSRPEAPRRPTYQFLPSGRKVMPPAGADNARPVLLSGTLFWLVRDKGLLREDGSPFLSFGLPAGARVTDVLRDPTGGRYALAWIEAVPNQRASQFFIGLAGAQGQLLQRFSAPQFSRLGAWLDGSRVLGNYGLPFPGAPQGVVTNTPSIFDLAAGTVHGLPEAVLHFGARNYVRAVIQGPFARVVNTGSCLRIRDEPVTGQSVACEADGVLLRDLGESRQVASESWLRVATPAGVEGWASVAYLER